LIGREGFDDQFGRFYDGVAGFVSPLINRNSTLQGRLLYEDTFLILGMALLLWVFDAGV
jgi:hypothetical protein